MKNLKFNLVICTYERPEAIKKLLESVFIQSLIPNEILVIDASPNDLTMNLLEKNQYSGIKYFKVGLNDRGLTRQRNYGIKRTSSDVEIICFLDDDIILRPDYFEKLLQTYTLFPDAIGVGGYIINEIEWLKNHYPPSNDEFEIDGYKRYLGSRNLLRKRLGLLSDQPPGYMPDFSNGLSIGFLPPSDKTYPVEFFMGGVASFRKQLFEKISFSEYFEGYGLYEDLDFCLRASKLGQLYVNTSAIVSHYHAEAGRPNKFKYGNMVIRNGWYVWRIKFPNPDFKARLKWHSTAFLLTLVRLGNVITTSKRKEALTESLGRIAGWWSLFFKKPGKDV